MAKSYKVTLGGIERELKYTRQERELLEERFSMGLLKLLKKRVMPVGEDGKPTGGGMVRAQNALVWAGLKHLGPKWSERYVDDMIDKEQASGGNPYSIYGAAMSAVFASGVLGFTVTDDEVDEAADEGKEDSEGSATS